MKGKKAIATILILALAISICITAQAEKETKYYLTQPMARIKTTHDQGYYYEEEINENDPHYKKSVHVCALVMK